MDAIALVFLLASATAVMTLPRKWVPVPLLAGCFYMTVGQGVDVGPVSLPVFRIIIAAGLARVVIRREKIAGGVNTIDKLTAAWAVWIVVASLFHQWMPGSGPVYATGFVFNVVGVYLLTRVWCSDVAELMTVLRIVAWLIVPVALAMTVEQVKHFNVFGMLGGVPTGVYIRDGAIRAQGPFQHPILAGTVGAVCAPLMIGIWRDYRASSSVGLVACFVIVFASHSSGPMVSLMMGLFGVITWLYRPAARLMRWAAIGAYVSAELLMTRPAYYLISKFDLTGSSTGWHRSRLIEAAFAHLGEWWAYGTDYTGHWMPYTLGSNGQHADLTNYYLFVGVIGGLPAMLLLIAMMWCAFVWVGRSVRDAPSKMQEKKFMIWCLGAGLFAHAGTSLSVAYFDQSMTLFWLNIGAISSMHSIVAMMRVGERRPSVGVTPEGRRVPPLIAFRGSESRPHRSVRRPFHRRA